MFNRRVARTNTKGWRAFIMMFRRFTHFRGYSSRREFFHALFFIFLLYVIIVPLALFLVEPFVYAALFMLIMATAVLIVPFLSMLFRRMGDAGFPRWFPLTYIGIFIPGNVMNVAGVMLTIGDILAMVLTGFFLVLACFPTSHHLIIIKPEHDDELNE